MKVDMRAHRVVPQLFRALMRAIHLGDDLVVREDEHRLLLVVVAHRAVAAVQDRHLLVLREVRGVVHARDVGRAAAVRGGGGTAGPGGGALVLGLLGVLIFGWAT